MGSNVNVLALQLFARESMGLWKNVLKKSYQEHPSSTFSIAASALVVNGFVGHTLKGFALCVKTVFI